jgi:hypothetical protein
MTWTHENAKRARLLSVIGCRRPTRVSASASARYHHRGVVPATSNNGPLSLISRMPSCGNGTCGESHSRALSLIAHGAAGGTPAPAARFPYLY